MQNEPRGGLPDLQRPRQLAGRNAVAIGGQKPNGGEPFVKSDGRVLKDRADLGRELLLAFLAKPEVLRRSAVRALLGTRLYSPLNSANVGVTTAHAGASNTVRPADRDEVVVSPLEV